jgi:hypothetical protein
MAKAAQSTVERQVLTFWSCGERTDRRRRASANVTWAGKSGLMSSGKKKEKACGFGCKGSCGKESSKMEGSGAG